MGCCASTFQRAPTSARTARTILRPWRWPSTAGRERPWAGGHRPRLWTSSFDPVTEAVLRRPLESTAHLWIVRRADELQRRREALGLAPPAHQGLDLAGGARGGGRNRLGRTGEEAPHPAPPQQFDGRNLAQPDWRLGGRHGREEVVPIPA